MIFNFSEGKCKLAHAILGLYATRGKLRNRHCIARPPNVPLSRSSRALQACFQPRSQDVSSPHHKGPGERGEIKEPGNDVGVFYRAYFQYFGCNTSPDEKKKKETRAS